MKSLINPDQFHRDGISVARGVFNKSELDRLEALANTVREKVNRELPSGTRFWLRGHPQYGGMEPANVPNDIKRHATWGVNELPRKSLFEPELVNVLGHPNIDNAIKALLGDEPHAWGIKLLWSPRLQPYDLGWHRDQLPNETDVVAYKPEANDHIQFNAALHDDECFIAVPGSHRRALTAAERGAVRTTDLLPGQVVVKLNPGDVLFMDAHALHRGRCAIDSDRLTLHYSCRAGWLPVKPWGADGHFDWITSDAFIEQLSPETQPYYRRLRERPRTDDAMSFLFEAAGAAGWKG